MVADIGHRYISEGAKGSALEHKKIGRLIANGGLRRRRRRRHPRPLGHRSPSRPLRFMEHSVHSIFSIVDRPYLSYLCFF